MYMQRACSVDTAAPEDIVAGTERVLALVRARAHAGEHVGLRGAAGAGRGALPAVVPRDDVQCPRATSL